MTRRRVVSLLAAVAGWVAASPSLGRVARAQAASFELDPIGSVSFPDAEDFLILDSANSAWTDLGPRKVLGVVYHRLDGDLGQLDAFLRSPEGGARGLFDIGVDNTTGAIRVWNDPFGAPHPGVSENRAPWANGPVENPVPGASAFVDDHSSDAVNRDLVSIGIAGQQNDAISDACLESVARLSAYFAASFNPVWTGYPSISGKSYGFVHLHNDFAFTKSCPGPVVIDAVPEIVARSAKLLTGSDASSYDG